MKGRIVAAYGRHYLVEAEDNAIVECVPRGKKSEFACGDNVSFQLSAPAQGVLENHAQRSNLIERAAPYRRKRLAANVSQLFVVVSGEPGFSEDFLTRCLIVAEYQSVPATILLNKSDLTEATIAARKKLQPFEAAGYTVMAVSALDDVPAITAKLRGQTTLLIGQSGMGKSTLLNRIVPDANAATNTISQALRSGKHTTTATRLYSLDESSALIDSPGFEEFGLFHLSLGDVEDAFVEFRPYMGKCRFRDCRHEAEPDCAILAAVAAGTISQTRLTHFHAITRELKRQEAAAY